MNDITNYRMFFYYYIIVGSVIKIVYTLIFSCFEGGIINMNRKQLIIAALEHRATNSIPYHIDFTVINHPFGINKLKEQLKK